MGLLGKTLKGRSTMRTEKVEPRNVRFREIELTTKDQVTNEIERRKLKESLLLKQIASE